MNKYIQFVLVFILSLFFIYRFYNKINTSEQFFPYIKPPSIQKKVIIIIPCYIYSINIQKIIDYYTNLELSNMFLMSMLNI